MKLVVFATVLVALLAASTFAAVEIQDPVAIHNIGYFAYEQGEFELAQRLFERAIELDKNYEHARNSLAVLYHEQEQYADAARQLDALLQIDNQNVQYWYDLGVNLIAEFREHNEVENFYYGLAAYEQAELLDADYAYLQENLQVLYSLRQMLEG